eukprot:808384_1
MDSLIKFRATIRSLTGDEFFGSFISTIGRELVTTLLFEGFLRELHQNKNNHVKKANDVIYNIYQARKPKSNTKTKISLDRLPYPMLYHITTFLDFANSLQFEKANRSIFIGSRSSRLPTHSLDSNHFAKLIQYCDHNRQLSLETLPSFKAISILAEDIIEYDEAEDEFQPLCSYPWNFNPILSIFNHIGELIFKIDDDKSAFFGDELLGRTQLDNIHTIRCTSSASYKDEDVTAVSLFDVFRAAENRTTLQFWEVSGRFVVDESPGEEISKLISQLRGIALNFVVYNQRWHAYAAYGMGDIRSSIIYPLLSNRLQSFHKTLHLFTDAINGKFNEVQELCVPWRMCKDDINILNNQNLSNIRRIFFNNVDVAKDLFECGIINENDIDKYQSDAQSMELLMHKLIQSLEYICIDVDLVRIAFDFIHIVGKCLASIPFKRNKLKFRMNGLHLVDKQGNLIKSILSTFTSLVGILNSKYEHFMFICCDLQIPTGICDFIKCMREKHVVHVEESDKRYDFVISNTHCSMTGYRE